MTQTRPQPAPLVFAAAPYLNSAPLTEGLHGRDDVRLIEGDPATLVALLASRRADVALVPVVDLLADPQLTMVDGLGVGANGKVASVLLRCGCPPGKVIRVAPDPRSHTSNLLALLLLRLHWGATSASLSGDEPTTAEATVMIGDRALQPRPTVHAEYDLAEEWRNMTGLPFVFAVWAYRRDHARAADLSRLATESYAAGRDAIEAIAERFSRRLGLTPAFCREYLTQRICYAIGDHEQRAINRFGTLLHEQRLTPEQENGIAL